MTWTQLKAQVTNLGCTSHYATINGLWMPATLVGQDLNYDLSCNLLALLFLDNLANRSSGSFGPC